MPGPAPSPARAGGLIASFILIGCSQHALAQRNSDVEGLSTLIFENDQFNMEDGGYTNGLGYSWTYGPFDDFAGRVPGWLETLGGGLYVATMQDKRRRHGYSVIQEIYTPEETGSKVADPDDRPYAGLLTWQTNWYAYDDRVTDRLELELGIVGELSLAEGAQKVVHEITSADKPEGWDDQLENEPIFRVGAHRGWRLLDGLLGAIEYDVIGHLAGNAGTRRSDAATGVSFRIGNGLQGSFANVSLTPVRDGNWNRTRRGAWSVFLNLSGTYVFNDITLDGNTFENSPSVDLENSVGSAIAGASWNIGSWGWLFTMRALSDEFETQKTESVYGSLTVSYHFETSPRRSEFP
jgi:hypothetical protein